MAWFKTDDALHSHPKARKAGLEAMGLWVLAGSHAMQYLSDGFVPVWYVDSWPHGRRCANSLVRAGLWLADEQDGERGWRFKDWDHYQPTRDEIEADRESARERQKRFRQARRDAKNKAQNKSTDRAIDAMRNGVTDGVTNGVTNDPPLPTRPDPALSNLSQVGGGGYVSSDAPSTAADSMPDDYKPWRCADHQDVDVKCHGCALAKKAHRKQLEDEAAAAKAAQRQADADTKRAERERIERERAEAEADPDAGRRAIEQFKQARKDVA